MKKQWNQKPDALWLSVSPHLKGFDQRLLVQLSSAAVVRRWEYCQSVDEPCCIDAVVESLHEYLTLRAAKANGNSLEKSQPIHLMGHGVSGVVGLLYARKYPQQVASLTLLSVGSQPAVNWQAHYYALRQLLPCRREMILAHMARLLFGENPLRFAKALAVLLARDLDSNLTLHSLAHRSKIASGGVDVPLLVCNGAADIVMNRQPIAWEGHMKLRDRLWNCPDGNHFFHFHHPEATARKITHYWQNLQQIEQSPEHQNILSLTEHSSSENNIVFLPSSTP